MNNKIIKIIGIVLIIFWILGFISIITEKSYPDNIFTWFGTLLPLIIGIILLSKSDNYKTNNGYTEHPKWLKIIFIIAGVLVGTMLLFALIGLFNYL